MNVKRAPVFMPKHLEEGYTMSGLIPVYEWYINEVESKTIDWTIMLDSFLERFTPEKIKNKEHGRESYDNAALYHVQAFEKYSLMIKDKNVAVVGSLTPWIESILLNMGVGHCTTVEYNVPKVNHEKLSAISFDDFKKSDKKYDVIVSYSSIEHSGLGRYGDPLDPNGDLDTMDVIHEKLSENGLVFMGLPVGKDALVWNVHRVYGEIRLGLMFERFEEIEWIGLEKEYIYTCEPMNNGPQPIIVLRK